MKRQNLPGPLGAGPTFKTIAVLLCLMISCWIGFAENKSGALLEIDSANVELNRLHTMIKKGSNEFFRSYSDALKVMAHYEKAAKQSVNFNFAVSRTKLKSAVLKLQNTKKIYRDVVELCHKKDFRPIFREKWMFADYTKVEGPEPKSIKSQSNANQYLLEVGIQGLYQQNIRRADEIIIIMKQIDRDLEMGIKPDVTSIWKLLQKYSGLLKLENTTHNAMNQVPNNTKNGRGM
jgi:hypothetical protein